MFLAACTVFDHTTESLRVGRSSYEIRITDNNTHIDWVKDKKVFLQFSSRQESSEHPAWVPDGQYFRVVQPKCKSPFPVVLIAGHAGLGHQEDRLFCAIYRGSVIVLGRPPTPWSNGPINYRGRRDLWLFDDFDYYDNMTKPQHLHYVLFKIKGGRLERVKSWLAAGGKRLPKTVHIVWR